MDRDYSADMRAVIDAETGDGPYEAAVVAEHIVSKLVATDADLLDGWLRMQAVNVVRDAIAARDRSGRAYARRASGRSVFANDAAAHEAGDGAALAGWLGTVHVLGDHTRVRLADMRKPELLHVADDYARQAAENRMQEAFLRAIAKKVGRGTVADHFTDEQLSRMWRSLGGTDN